MCKLDFIYDYLLNIKQVQQGKELEGWCMRVSPWLDKHVCFEIDYYAR